MTDPGRLPADAWMQRDQRNHRPPGVFRGPVTIDQALARGLQAMLDEDEAERRQRDPVGYLGARERQRTLWGRLFGR